MTDAAMKAHKNTKNDNVGNTILLRKQLKTMQPTLIGRQKNPMKSHGVHWRLQIISGMEKPRYHRSYTATGFIIWENKRKTAEIQKELPKNATTIHPVLLLNQIRPGLTYHEISRVGDPPNTIFTLGVHVEGQKFTGAGKTFGIKFSFSSIIVIYF